MESRFWPHTFAFLAALIHALWQRARHGIAPFAALILLDRSGWSLAFDARYWIGYIAAGACAVTWASYSVLSRRFGDVPTVAVGGFCGATAMLGLIAHLALETTQMPSATGWLAILALGIGPVGLAFFLWDRGVKHGDIKLLGVAAYAAPLLSTPALVVSGVARATPALAAACLLIVGGAALAAGLFSGRKTSLSGSR